MEESLEYVINGDDRGYESWVHILVEIPSFQG